MSALPRGCAAVVRAYGGDAAGDAGGEAALDGVYDAEWDKNCVNQGAWAQGHAPAQP